MVIFRAVLKSQLPGSLFQRIDMLRKSPSRTPRPDQCLSLIHIFAREFHDTLEQELAAIAIQLDAVEAQLNESPETVRRLLGLARNMSRRSLSEARRSVWDLRSHLLENADLVAALTEMAAPLSAASGVEIVVHSTGAPRKLPAVTCLLYTSRCV